MNDTTVSAAEHRDLGPTRTTRTSLRPEGSVDDHAHLLLRVRAGDRDALARLIERFTPLVRATARRRCARPEDVDDIVQEVWVTLMRRADTIHSPACLPGWLRRVTDHAGIEAGRRCRTVPMAEPPEDPGPSAGPAEDGPLAGFVLETRRVAVHRALGRLSAPDRFLIDLLMADDRPDYRSVSARTGRPVGSLGPTRGRLLRRLATDPDIARIAEL